MSVTRSAAVAAALIVVLLVGGITELVLSGSRSNAASTRAAHARTVQDAVDDSLQAVLEVQTGLRAYLLTGETAVLTPYRDGQALFATKRPILLSSLADDSHLSLARSIVFAIHGYIADHARPLAALRARGRLSDREVSRRTVAGEARVAHIRAMVGQLESVEEAEDTATIAGATHAATRDRTIGIAALGATLALLVLFGLVLRRGFLAPLRELRSAAERLSQGDLTVRVGDAASREFAPVHAALDDMAGNLDAHRRELAEHLEDARMEVLHRLARATEYRDDDTHEHTERVASTAALIAREMGVEPGVVDTLRLAAMLHDVGKIGISDTILLKPGKLTDAEYAEMQRHTTFGAEMLAGSPSPILRMAERIALGHHERWDGGGYPMGLHGAATPLVARIVAVADVFDALTNERPYKEAWPLQRAVAEIRSQAGRQFDPDVVAAFLTAVAGPALSEEALELARDHVA